MENTRTSGSSPSTDPRQDDAERIDALLDKVDVLIEQYERTYVDSPSFDRAIADLHDALLFDIVDDLKPLIRFARAGIREARS